MAYIGLKAVNKYRLKLMTATKTGKVPHRSANQEATTSMILYFVYKKMLR